MFRKQRHNACRGTGATGVPAGVPALIPALIPGALFGLSLFCAAELSVAYASACLLESGVADASKLIRTARVRDMAHDMDGIRGAFEARLCESTFSLIDCADIAYDATVVDGAAGAIHALSFNAADAGRGAFEPGMPGETVLVRAVYAYDFKLPLIAAFVPGRGKIVSSYVVANAPVPDGQAGNAGAGRRDI